MARLKRCKRILDCDVTIVMPAYNLERVISESVRRVCNVLKHFPYSFEIIVVDDGSNDETYREALRAQCDGGSVRAYKLPRNMGKGFALMHGFYRSRGRRIVFFDADLDIDPWQIPYMLRVMDETGADIVVTSKWHPLSRTRASLERRLLSTGFRLLVRLLVGLPLTDTQTGAKAFKRRVLEDIAPRLTVKRYAFDVELLAAAHARGYRIVEVPALWEIRLTSRFKPREIIRMFTDLLAVTYRHRLLHWYNTVG